MEIFRLMKNYETISLKKPPFLENCTVWFIRIILLYWTHNLPILILLLVDYNPP